MRSHGCEVFTLCTTPIPIWMCRHPFRHHPTEFLVGSGLFWIVVVVTGFPADIGAVYLLCASVLTFCQHGNINLPPSWEPVLQKIIVTPDMHCLHHSLVPKEANSNFGFLFSFWDHLFASHREVPRVAHNGIEFGLMQFRNPNISLMLLLPLLLRRAAIVPK